MILNSKKIKTFILESIIVLIIVGFISFGLSVIAFSCGSSSKNITNKKSNCLEISHINAMPCCQQYMTGGKSDNDSKDIVCAGIINETVLNLKQIREKSAFDYCFIYLKEKTKTQNPHNCYDKISK